MYIIFEFYTYRIDKNCDFNRKLERMKDIITYLHKYDVYILRNKMNESRNQISNNLYRSPEREGERERERGREAGERERERARARIVTVIFS